MSSAGNSARLKGPVGRVAQWMCVNLLSIKNMKKKLNDNKFKTFEDMIDMTKTSGNRSIALTMHFYGGASKRNIIPAPFNNMSGLAMAFLGTYSAYFLSCSYAYSNCRDAAHLVAAAYGQGGAYVSPVPQ
eukprot:GHVL01028664.1.p1 GENE.GHVL01028664.1~~GHVL01028664.1.p1  ORF type:complete len:130 (+),score=21.11 GHVL01028664.1:48-437(+)